MYTKEHIEEFAIVNFPHVVSMFPNTKASMTASREKWQFYLKLSSTAEYLKYTPAFQRRKQKGTGVTLTLSRTTSPDHLHGWRSFAADNQQQELAEREYFIKVVWSSWSNLSFLSLQNCFRINGWEAIVM